MGIFSRHTLSGDIFSDDPDDDTDDHICWVCTVTHDPLYTICADCAALMGWKERMFGALNAICKEYEKYEWT